VRGWCPSPRQGRPSGSKSTYKGIYIYLPPKTLGLKPGTYFKVLKTTKIE